jgi:hypothetical protein
MRKLAIASLAGLLALSAPALAQARSHHAKHHQRRHHHTHVLFLHPAPKSSTGTQGAGTESPQAAGSVTTFEGGVLTVTLTDGTKVTGKVTEQTEIKCEPETAHAADLGGGDEDSHGSFSGNENQGRDDQGDDQNDQGEHGERPQCDTSSLVGGALVREAELRVGSSGAVFEEIELVG